MALVLFWGGLAIGVGGIIFDTLLGLILGLITAFIGVAMWRGRR